MRSEGVNGLIFSFDEAQKLRFCKPTDGIQTALTKSKNSYYLPDECSAEEAVALINRHAEEAFVNG